MFETPSAEPSAPMSDDALEVIYSRADLERADRYIAAAESRMERQRRMVDEYKARGWPLEEGLTLLGLFEDTLQQLVAHRAEVAKQLEQASATLRQAATAAARALNSNRE